MLKKWRMKFPFLCCILIIIFYLLIFEGFSLCFSSFLHDENAQQFWPAFFTDCVLLPFVILFGLSHAFTHRGKNFFYGLFIGGYIVVMGAFTLISTLVSAGIFAQVSGSTAFAFRSGTQILFFLLSMLFTGITEEMVFRGMVQNIIFDWLGTKKRRNIIFTVALSGVLFGACHMANIFAGVTVRSALVQAFLASLVGMMFGAIYLRTQNIWTMIVLHAWNDFCSLAVSGLLVGTASTVDNVNEYSWGKFAVIPIYLVLIAVLLRPKKLKEIQASALR